MKRALERVEVPDAQAAERRVRAVVVAALAEREPVPARPRPARLAAALAAGVVAILAGAALSPPGQAVVERIREAVGVEGAQPALFRLPTDGRLLVASDVGVWIVDRDGKKRLLAGYREASWSPFGRYVVAAKQNELAALEPDGDVRWTLARPDVRAPRWAGTKSDTRIAYLSAGSLRVVGGDGSNDRRLRAHVRPVAPAWRGERGFVVTYVTATGAVVTEDVERRVVLWRSPTAGRVLQLAWSTDGRKLVVRRAHRVDVLTRDGSLFTGFRPQSSDVTASAVRRGTHEHSHAFARAGKAEVVHIGEGGGRLFAGAGRFSELAWSPDGRWLLVGWPTADQWVFVRADGRRIRAVANVSAQLRTRTFPRVEGWCC